MFLLHIVHVNSLVTKLFLLIFLSCYVSGVQSDDDESRLSNENATYSSPDDTDTDDSTASTCSSSATDSELDCDLSGDQAKPSDTDEQFKAEFCLLSCFLRNNFSANSSKDVIRTMQNAFPDCESLGKLSYEKLWGFLEADFAYEVHYCEKCQNIFPDNPGADMCHECGGPRYKAGINRVKQARCSFVYANIERQLKNLLLSPGKYKIY
jgi:hypothetical protein